MKKRFKSILGIMLVLALCLSFMPVSAFAAPEASDTAVQAETISNEDITDEITPEPTDEVISEPDPDLTPTPEPAPESTPEPVSEAPASADIQPELLKVVKKPLVKVVYHYYDETQGREVSDFAHYAIASSHSYYAIAMANGADMTIAANKFLDKVPVSTDSLRFRVLLNGSEDITALAAYDAAAGLVSLPREYMGHELTVMWYCPTSEATELPVKATICVWENGAFSTIIKDLFLPSDANSITVPLTITNGLVVSQNGIDLTEDMYSADNGTLNISAAALGGDISVSAYALSIKGTGIGIMPLGTDLTKVDHTRSEDQIYYGYYTSYYEANGNTAFCLDPTASGLNSGNYNISRYLERDTGYNTLIKCAYYLYGGPGYNSIKNDLFTYPNTMEAYGLCHAIAAYAYLGDSDAWLGLDSATIQRLKDDLDTVKAQPMPPLGFDVFIYNESSTTSQPLLSWDYTPSGDLEIIKVSGNPAMTDGNDCYSLQGAVFDVYDSDDKKIGSITTDKNGKGKLEDIPAGTGYYIVEKKPPKGFAGNSTKITFKIVSEETTTVQVSNIPQNDPIGILLRKQDADTSSATPQGGAGLGGAEFTVNYYKGLYTADQLSGLTPARTWVLRTDDDGTAFLDAAYLVSGDPFYFAGNGDPTIPLGTITIQETKAPTGYVINNNLFIRQITSEGTAESVKTYNEPVVKEEVVRGGVSIEKWDYELNRRADPQGDGSLAISVLDIYNRNDESVVVDGKTYAPGEIVHTMTTDATGAASTANNLLPYGSYEIIERTAPTGYLNTGVIRQTFDIENNGEIVSLKSNDTTIKNNPIRGGVEIEKWDIERDQAKLKQGDATLAVAVFEIWNRSPRSVMVGGSEYAPNTVVHTMTTNADGWAGTANDLLPYGSYEIVERTAPTGYLNTGIIKREFEIRKDGEIVSLKASDEPIKNDIIRGGVRVEKWDNEIDEHRPQGGATFENAVFEIVNRSADSVLVQDTLYNVGEVVYTFATDETGSAITPDDLLPYGTYEVREASPPEGYLATGVLSRVFKIREHKKVVELNTSDSAIKNNPIRGDLRGVKISDGDTNRMANVPFRITSKTTGESHVIITDINGEFNTASSWNPHSQNTNRGETDRDGIWFGELRVLNDDLGALLYDTYLLEELPCEANKDKELLAFEVSVYRHMTVIDLGTLTDDYIPVPEIFTTAMDKEMLANAAHVSETTTILDTVYYSGLKAGRMYTLKGVLMDAETGAPLLIDGEQVTAETTFRAPAETGSMPMEFTFDSTGIAGKSVVVFESLEYEGKEIASHSDIDDEGQTVTFMAPKIGTSAAGADGGKELDIRTKVTLIDTVSYENLIAGETYTLKGVLMDKEAGEALLVDGEAVTAEATFKPTVSSGTVEVVFTFDSVNLIGKTAVVFESLEYMEREIAVHADTDDEGQTVAFKEPKIGTTAAGIDGEKGIDIYTEATIKDTVSYENLAIGEEYMVKGVLMDKESGEPLLIDGAEVTAETTFKPESPSGSVEVVFTFNSTSLIGKTAVVFESLECAGHVIAEHADITDERQTVTFKEPKIGTMAKAEDGSKAVPIAESVTVVDTVTYENLVPQQKYVLKGVLMDKESGLPLMKDGVAVTAETEFVPIAPSGSVEVRFTFDSRAIGGRTLVVFETLECGGQEVAAHADINDEAQCVTIDANKPEPVPTPTPNKPEPGKPVPQTGDDYMVVLWLALAGIALSGLLVSIVFLCKKRRKAVIFLALCAILMAGSIFMAFAELRQYSEGAETYAGLEQFITPPVSDDEAAPKPSGQEETPFDTMDEEAGFPASSLPSVDFDALRALNPDIVGWLLCDDMSINYPIAQSADNSRYLNHLYNGKRGKAGTPFLDYENSPDFTDGNNIVYGHNLLDGSMFSSLTKYREQAYYDAHPSMLLFTPDAAYRMEIFAAFTANPGEAGKDISPWRQAWDTDADFAAWLKQTTRRSVVQTNISPASEDKVLTLSTCVNRGRDRFLVMGRLVPAE